MSKPKTTELSHDDMEWMMKSLDFIREVAEVSVNNANPQDLTVAEWRLVKLVFYVADDIHRMLDDKMGVHDEPRY